MATPTEIAALRLLIAEPTDAIYSDTVLGQMLDAGTDQYSVASEIWIQKAATSAGFVDVSEGGSSRKMGDLHEQALAMAETMKLRSSTATPADGLGPGLRISRLTRP